MIVAGIAGIAKMANVWIVKMEMIVQEVNVYTHRHYPTDQELFAQFEKQTGIKVNVVNASADELMQKMIQEGEQSPADVLITVG